MDGLLEQAEGLGFDFRPYIENGLAKFLFLNINKKLVYETMIEEILSGNYHRIVLDSITPLSEMPVHVLREHRSDDLTEHDSEELKKEGIPVLRLNLMFIVHTLETAKATAMITSEIPVGSKALSRDTMSEYISDGVIFMNYDADMDERILSIMKMRNTYHTQKPQPIRIGLNGISFGPFKDEEKWP